jgi:hypothetical protein
MPSPDGSCRPDPRVNASAECAADRDETKPATDSTRVGKLVHWDDGLQWVFRLASRRTGAALLTSSIVRHQCFTLLSLTRTVPS